MTGRLAREALARDGRVGALALALATAERDGRGATAVDLARMLQALPLERQGGLNLLRLAEALPRTPDLPTRIALLADKLDPVDWSEAATDEAGAIGMAVRAAMPAARALLPDPGAAAAGAAPPALARAVVAPTARAVLERIGRQFVHAATIEGAIARAGDGPSASLASFDMLGEGARCWVDADRNLERYVHAISAVGAVAIRRPAHERHGVSIKISAVHPRFELPRYRRERDALRERLLVLALAAARADVPLNVDAEESDRLAMTLDLFEWLALEPSLAGWGGLGVVIQAYLTASRTTADRLVAAARRRRESGGAPIAVRLVKGAYWDHEVKRAQELGLRAYPVFTRKADTDRAYADCALVLLDAADVVRPQFATHNAVTAAFVLLAARERGVAAGGFELQRLHGMGAGLHDAVRDLAGGARAAPPGVAFPMPCLRIYAPVGEQRDLLAYLVRRILENGASTSFVRRFADPRLDVGALVAAELAALQEPDR